MASSNDRELRARQRLTENFLGVWMAALMLVICAIGAFSGHWLLAALVAVPCSTLLALHVRRLRQLTKQDK